MKHASFLRLTLLGCILSTGASAQNVDGAVTHRVIAGWTQADGTHMAALELTLAPGWKTYWRTPGDAGIPPHFDWRSAGNISDVHVHWPSPGVFWESGMRSIGYEGQVVLPLTISPQRQGGEVRLRGTMNLGICSDICVPATLEIDTTLPTGAGTRSPGIVAALAALPFSGPEAGVRAAVCDIKPTADGMQIRADITMPHTGGTEHAVIEAGDPSIWVSEPKATRSGRTLTVEAEMWHQSGTGFAVNRSDVRITVIGGSQTVDIQGCTGS